MGIDKRVLERMDAIERRLDRQDVMLRGDEENAGLMSVVRQLAEESKQRKYIQTTILIGVIALLIERLFRMIGIAIDRL